MTTQSRPSWRWPTVVPLVRANWVCLIVAGLLIVATRYVKLNVEASVPYGFYRMVAVPPVLERGMLVLLDPPAVIHRWRPWWQPMLKPVAGVAGDQVCVLSVGLWVRGEPYGRVVTEAHGAALPRLRGCFVVPAGTVFLASRQGNSLDGRYFGVTRVTEVTAWALPWWTWR